MNFNKNSNIYIYLRVSTKNQFTNSYGVENQKKLCEQYIKENICPLKRVFISIINVFLNKIKKKLRTLFLLNY